MSSIQVVLYRTPRPPLRATRVAYNYEGCDLNGPPPSTEPHFLARFRPAQLRVNRALIQNPALDRNALKAEAGSFVFTFPAQPLSRDFNKGSVGASISGGTFSRGRWRKLIEEGEAEAAAAAARRAEQEAREARGAAATRRGRSRAAARCRSCCGGAGVSRHRAAHGGAATGAVDGGCGARGTQRGAAPSGGPARRRRSNHGAIASRGTSTGEGGELAARQVGCSADQEFDEAMTRFIPAHSASKTRVNALMQGIQAPRTAALGPRFRGDERKIERDRPP
jgi:hypothetical protein